MEVVRERMRRHIHVGEEPRRASELIVLGLACLSPWAIGAVDAWAQLALDVGIALLAILGIVAADRAGWARRLFCVPSLALLALALLALVQAVPLPEAMLKGIAPATDTWRRGLAPDVPQRVKGAEGPPVAPPASTLSHDPDASLRSSAQLMACWLLFQCVLGLGRGHGLLRRFGMVTVVNCLVMTLFAIAQSLTWNGKIYGIRQTRVVDPWLTGGPFVLHNHLAAYLNVGFGLALGFLI